MELRGPTPAPPALLALLSLVPALALEQTKILPVLYALPNMGARARVGRPPAPKKRSSARSATGARWHREEQRVRATELEVFRSRRGSRAPAAVSFGPEPSGGRPAGNWGGDFAVRILLRRVRDAAGAPP